MTSYFLKRTMRSSDRFSSVFTTSLTTTAMFCIIVWFRNKFSSGKKSNAFHHHHNHQILSQWKRKQNEYRKMILEVDDENMKDPELIAGVDISFIKGDNINACACIAVMSFPDLQVVHTMCRMIRLSAPYIAGYLAFRECDPLLEMIRDLKDRFGSRYTPDIIMVDGNGVLHPRGVGTSSYFYHFFFVFAKY